MQFLIQEDGLQISSIYASFNERYDKIGSFCFVHDIGIDFRASAFDKRLFFNVIILSCQMFFFCFCFYLKRYLHCICFSRVSVIRGQIFYKKFLPLIGVKVQVFNNPNQGYTISDRNGL